MIITLPISQAGLGCWVLSPLLPPGYSNHIYMDMSLYTYIRNTCTSWSVLLRSVNPSSSFLLASPRLVSTNPRFPTIVEAANPSVPLSRPPAHSLSTSLRRRASKTCCIYACHSTHTIGSFYCHISSAFCNFIQRNSRHHPGSASWRA